MPRRQFGYAVSLAQGGRGILLPRPGRYRVGWGLFYVREDTARKTEGDWYALERCARDVTITPDKDSYTLDLGMTLDDLQATIDGLQEGMKAAKRK